MLVADILPEFSSLVQQYVIPFLWNALGAVVLWVVGGLVIAMALGYFASLFVEAPGLGGAGQ